MERRFLKRSFFPQVIKASQKYYYRNNYTTDVGAGLDAIILCQVMHWHTETNYKFICRPPLSSTHLFSSHFHASWCPFG